MPRISKLVTPRAAPAEPKSPGKTSARSSAAKVPSEVEEAFARLERARFELERFEQEHHKVIRQYEKLREEINSSMGDAKQTYIDYRGVLGPSYNGFYVSRKRSVNAELLAQLYPEIVPQLGYKLGIGDFDELVVQGQIPRDIADQVEVVTESVYSPKK